MGQASLNLLAGSVGSGNILHASTYWGHVVESPMKYVDGYYGYNFNTPIGGVNLLRAYDPTSNGFNRRLYGTH